MTVYTLEELQHMADEFLNRIALFNQAAHALYSTMRRTGLRFEDAHNPARWQSISTDVYAVTTAKKSNIRHLAAAEIDPRHAAMLAASTANPFPHSYSQYLRYFTMLFPKQQLMVKTKPIRTHIFRHIKAKELKENGSSDVDIQMYLGERRLTSAQEYIYSNIYTI